MVLGKQYLDIERYLLRTSLELEWPTLLSVSLEIASGLFQGPKIASRLVSLRSMTPTILVSLRTPIIFPPSSLKFKGLTVRQQRKGVEQREGGPPPASPSQEHLARLHLSLHEEYLMRDMKGSVGNQIRFYLHFINLSSLLIYFFLPNL